MSRLLALVWALVVVGTATAAAQSADPFATSEEANAPAASAAAEPSPAPAPPAAPPAASTTTKPRPRPAPTSKNGDPADWTGPRVALSYRLYSLKDSQGGGRVNTAGFSGFLPTRYVRAGGGLEAGARRYEYSDGEGLLSGNVFVGYQHLHDLGRFVPYAVVLGELGVLFEKRFHTPQTQLFRGAGLELGASVNLIRSLYVGVGVSFMLYTMDGLAYDTFGLRLSIGL